MLYFLTTRFVRFRLTLSSIVNKETGTEYNKKSEYINSNSRRC